MQHTPQFVEGGREIDLARGECEPASGEFLEQGDVVVDAGGNPWVLNLDGDGLAKGPGTVHLPDARGRGRHRVQVVELAQAFGPELTLENVFDDGEIDGLGFALECGENGRGLGGQQIAGVDGQELAGLHESPFEPSQALGDELGLLYTGTDLGQLECV
jgi:hypothetical protein